MQMNNASAMNTEYLRRENTDNIFVHNLFSLFDSKTLQRKSYSKNRFAPLTYMA